MVGKLYWWENFLGGKIILVGKLYWWENYIGGKIILVGKCQFGTLCKDPSSIFIMMHMMTCVQVVKVVQVVLQRFLQKKRTLGELIMLMTV